MNNSGIRIQKVLSDNGILSRRKAEDAVLAKRIKVNGRLAEIGQRINVRKDIITLDDVKIPLQKSKNNLYIILNKPRGYVTTTSDELGRKCVLDLIKDVPEKVYPIGRLDKVSEGLLMLTNDGEFANTIMHPSNQISKTYRATVVPAITEDQIIQLSTGVIVDGVLTLPASVHVLTKEPQRAVLQITIYEGRNRQIRKMCDAVGLEVSRLKRISIGPIKLGMLQPGHWRELKPSELIAMRNASIKAQNRATQIVQEANAKERDTPRRRPVKGGPKGGKR